MRLNGGTETQNLWPARWPADRANVVIYEDPQDGELGHLTKGAIALIEESDLPYFLSLGGITEIDEATANERGRTWRPDRAVVAKPDEVIKILADILVSGRKPTEKEIASLDPNNAEPGINIETFDIRRHYKR